MANGQQLAEQNFQIFCSWLASKSDNEFRQMVVRGSLSRREIAVQCGFASSVLNQNPRIKATLHEKESALRECGVLPARVIPSESEESSPILPQEFRTARQPLDAERLRRLELENAALRAENQELKLQLGKFTLLSEVLSSTGRLPR